MGQATDDEGDADPPQPLRAALGCFDCRDQDQRKGRAFDKIGMGAHAADQEFVAAIADRDACLAAGLAAADHEPDIDQCSACSDRERDG